MILSLVRFAFLFVAFFSSMNEVAFADETSTYKIHHHYLSTKAAGMGDAYIASVSDYSAIYYNPAALARRTDGQMNFAMNVGATPSISTLLKDIKSASDTQGDENAKAAAIGAVLEKTYGENYGMRLGLFEAAWVRPGWGIGILPADVSLDISSHRQLGPAINVRFVGDTTVAYGYAKDVNWIPSTRVSAGITGKFVNRVFADKSINALDLAVNSNVVNKSDLREGYTVDADLGFLLTPELPETGLLSYLSYAKPTFGLVIRNVAEMGFKKSLKLVNKDASGEAPEKLYRVIDVGTKWEYPSFWIFGGRGTLDVRDILHPAFNFRKGLHVGFEFDWTVTNWWKGHWRVGLNQMYFTAGASAELGIFNLDVSTYGEDIGTYSSPKENRIYMAKFNLDF